MTTRFTEMLSAYAARAYLLVLQAYPPEFRREYGESMHQAFNDLTRDACRRSGLAGLLRLWLVTGVDTVISLVAAYGQRGTSRLGKVTLTAGVLYLAILLGVVGFGAGRYRDFYDPPAFSRYGASESTAEDGLVDRYSEALRGDFGHYRAYVATCTLVLAVWLGSAAALFGRTQRAAWRGAVAFILGAGLTAGVLCFMPVVWFPLDRYPVGFLWTAGAAPVGMGASVVVALLLELQRLWATSATQ